MSNIVLKEVDEKMSTAVGIIKAYIEERMTIVSEEDFEKLKDYMTLQIQSHDDKEGLKTVRESYDFANGLKKSIEAEKSAMKRPLDDLGKFILKLEKKQLDEVNKTRDYLTGRKKYHKDLVEKEKQRKLAERERKRQKVYDMGAQFNGAFFVLGDLKYTESQVYTEDKKAFDKIIAELSKEKERLDQIAAENLMKENKAAREKLRMGREIFLLKKGWEQVGMDFQKGRMENKIPADKLADYTQEQFEELVFPKGKPAPKPPAKKIEKPKTLTFSESYIEAHEDISDIDSFRRGIIVAKQYMNANGFPDAITNGL